MPNLVFAGLVEVEVYPFILPRDIMRHSSYIKGTCDLLSGSPAPYVTMLNLVLAGLVDVEIYRF